MRSRWRRRGWRRRAWTRRAPTPRSSRRTSTTSSAASCTRCRTRSSTPRFWADIGRRENREPLQHITGRAYFRYLELDVGAGVFVPRPETEVMTGWAIDRLREMDVAEPVAVDLGTGSGAIALSIAQEVPRASVHAVEGDPLARSWAERNITRYVDSYTAGRVLLHAGRLRRRRPAARPEGAGVAGRHRRSGGHQPAVHPARLDRAARGGGVRPARGAVERRRRPGRDPRRSNGRPAGCCDPAACSPSSTARRRARRCSGCSARKPAGGTRPTTRIWPEETGSSRQCGRASSAIVIARPLRWRFPSSGRASRTGWFCLGWNQ